MSSTLLIMFRTLNIWKQSDQSFVSIIEYKVEFILQILESIWHMNELYRENNRPDSETFFTDLIHWSCLLQTTISLFFRTNKFIDLNTPRLLYWKPHSLFESCKERHNSQWLLRSENASAEYIQLWKKHRNCLVLDAEFKSLKEQQIIAYSLKQQSDPYCV